MKRILKIKRKAMAFMCAVLLVSMFPVNVGAAQKDINDPNGDWLKKGVDTSKTQVVYVDPKGDEWANYLPECLFPAKADISAKKIKNVKSSDPKVLKIDGVYNKSPKKSKKKAVVMDAFLMKPGNATVSFKYNGKTYKIKYVVKRFSNGIKSLKLGGYAQDYAPKFNAHKHVDVKGQKRPSQIRINMKSGWVVKEVKVISAGIRGLSKTIYKNSKGKSSVTVKDKTLGNIDLIVEVYCSNKKTGEVAFYNLLFDMLWEDEI